MMSLTVTPGIGSVDISGLPEGATVDYILTPKENPSYVGTFTTAAKPVVKPVNIKTKLSADGTAIEVILPLPEGTTGITYALVSADGSSTTYKHEPITVLTMKGTTAQPLVDAIATGPQNTTWAGRLTTHPAGPVVVPSGSIKFLPGVVLRSNESAVIARAIALKPKAVRFEVQTPGATYVAVCKQLVDAGIQPRPLVTYPLASNIDWKAFAVAGVDKLEFGNEMSYSYKNPTTAIARQYARDAKRSAEILRPLGIGITITGEDGGTGSSMFVDEMFAAVPDLLDWIDGWTVHPYFNGATVAAADTSGLPKVLRMMATLAKHGDTTKPIDVTEIGVPSDNGVVFASGQHATYSEAAQIMQQQIPKLRTAMNGRMRFLSVYQSEDQKPSGQKDRELYFGALKAGGATKEPYTSTIKTLLASG